MFLDETGATMDIIPRYGRAKDGARCLDTAPGGHWKSMTFIAGLRLNGITAPWCLDKAMTGEVSKTYLRTLLRKAMARSYERLWRTIGKLLSRFSKQECRNYFTNSGYSHT